MYDISEFPLVLAIPISRIVIISYHLDKQSAYRWQRQYKGATLYRNYRFAMLAATPDTGNVASPLDRQKESLCSTKTGLRSGESR